MLILHNVKILVDVRKNPISRKYGFSKHQLQRYVENIQIAYIHLPELGVPSGMRQNLDSDQAYAKLFKQYERDILSRQPEAVAKLRQIIGARERVALTCFEADHTSCHRSKITEYFQSDPSFEIPITHLYSSLDKQIIPCANSQGEQAL